MALYDSCAIYIRSATSKKDRIVKIEAVIEALLDSQLKAALGEDVSEYSLDDGQTKITTVYRTAGQITQSIMDLEALKNMYINQINGRVYRASDSKNFRRR